jgi:plasmid stability protein
MATLQVQSIDDNLYKALGHRANMDNRSISQEVVSILKAHLSLPKRHYGDSTACFLEMSGSWFNERPAQEIAEEIRQARHSSTRFKETF